MNDLMKMNTFYENDKNRHNIVIVLNKINNLEEIEIPIFRYFNEYKFNYWRDINE